MTDARLRSICVLGGGISGTLAAAALARSLSGMNLSITLIALDGDDPPPMALAMLPPIRALHRSLGLSDAQLVATAGATFRLGTSYLANPGRSEGFFVGYGGPAGGMAGIPAHQHWLRSASPALAHADLMPAAVAAALGRIDPDGRSWPQASGWLASGLHVDGELYLALLRQVAAGAGVSTLSGRFAGTERVGDSGFIAAIMLADGTRVAADLFIDASGATGLLIGGALGVGWQSWQALLPSDRLWSVRARRPGPPAPFAVARPTPTGWRLTLPLADHDVELVMASADIADPVAMVGDRALGPARLDRLTTGRRTTLFNHNVLALGEAGVGFDGLEASGLHHVQTSIAKLITALPNRDCGAETRYLDRLLCAAADRMADFHALLNRAAGPVASTAELDRKCALFDATGHVSLIDDEGYFEAGWAAALIGLGHRSRLPNALAATIPDDQAAAALASAAQTVRMAAARLPMHETVLAQLAAAWRAAPQQQARHHVG